MCGKTQIAKELSRRLDVPYFKAASEHQSFLKEPNKFVMQLRYADPRVADLLRQTGHSVIFDRAWPCEWVYSQALGRVTDWDALRHSDQLYASIGTKIVICRRASYEGIVDDIDPRLNGSLLAAIDGLYEEFSRWTKCETMFLNVDDEDLDREVSEIERWLRK